MFGDVSFHDFLARLHSGFFNRALNMLANLNFAEVTAVDDLFDFTDLLLPDHFNFLLENWFLPRYFSLNDFDDRRRRHFDLGPDDLRLIRDLNSGSVNLHDDLLGDCSCANRLVPSLAAVAGIGFRLHGQK
jgi:hypothetical protein